MRGKRGSGRGWSILKKKRDGHLVLNYRIEVRKPNGAMVFKWKQHRIPGECQTRTDAEVYATTFVESIAKASAEPTADTPEKVEPPSEPVLADFIERWLAYRLTLVAARRIRPATHKQDKGNWKMHIAPSLGRVPIAKLVEITPIREFIRAKSAEKANFTVRNIASTLKTMFDDIDAEGWLPLPRNPMRHKKVVELLPPPRTRAGRKVIVHIVQDDAQKLLQCREVESEHKIRYVTALTTGLRDGELRGLQVADVLLDGSAAGMKVRRALAVEGFDGRNTVQEPKTEDGVRDIPVQPLVVEALRWWLKTGWVRWVGRRPKAQDFLFPNAKGKPCRPRSSDQLRADLARAGCSGTYEGHNITMHALRRTFSTRLDDFPEAHRVKHDLMGHSGKGVDQIHYTATSQATKRRAIDSIQLDVSLGDITNGEAEGSTSCVAQAAE